MTALRQQAAALPLLPGVYLFHNAAGEILYVGKAIRLRERVRSYFAKVIGRGPGIDQMVKEAIELKHEVTGSEMEALLLEARLIRQHKPKYNIKLRDDKSFSLIRIDLSEDFPGIYLSREKDLEELLARKKRQRSDVSKISQKINSQEFYGPYISAGSVRIALKTIRKIWPFRDCSASKYSSYAKLGHGCLFATLGLCDAPCVGKISIEEYRKNIDQVRAFLHGDRERVLQMVQTDMEQASQDERFEQASKLRDRLQGLLHIQDVADTRRFLGAQQRSDFYTYDSEKDLLVECYDISNNQGAYAVGSQIVGVLKSAKFTTITTRDEARKAFFLDKSRYRKFRIKNVEGISDTDMVKEVLTRRMLRAKREGGRWALPDLLLIDGGLGQLHVAQKVRADMELVDKVAIAAVAKGPTRKRVDLRGEDFQRLPTVENEAWLLIAELLREEAHRFAITFYRSLHRKEMLKGTTPVGPVDSEFVTIPSLEE